MRKLYIFSLLIVCCSIVAWCQDCRVDGAASFTDVTSAVLRFTTQHMYTGWDAKIWNRSGDMAAVAIVKTIPDPQMTSPNTLRDVLFILHEAWACPSRCIKSSSDQQPNVTVLLLEHLHAKTSGPIQSEIDKTRISFWSRRELPTEEKPSPAGQTRQQYGVGSFEPCGLSTDHPVLKDVRCTTTCL